MPGGQRLELMLPGLEGRDYAVTSDQDERYNCIVWALGDDGRRWDPFDELGAYWLADVPRDDALRTVQLMFERLGFAICDGDAVEAEFEKIALYGIDEMFTHVARQLPNGRWTSKLGTDVDIEHDLQDVIRRRSPSASYRYGEIVGYMRRSRRSSDANP